MKRTVEADSTELEQQRGLRDHFVRVMNGLLADPDMRADALLIPAANFSRLVLANTERMHWDKPLSVFTEFPQSRVRMNTDAVYKWLDSEKLAALVPRIKPLQDGEHHLSYREVYALLFTEYVTYVPWTTFLATFNRVALETVARITARRHDAPRRITLLMLNNEEVNKSNAWLTGLAWATFAPVVDYVVANGNATHMFMSSSGRLTATQLNGPSPPTTRMQSILNTIVSFFGVFRKTHRFSSDGISPEMRAFLDEFEIDVIYVDDMIYSGIQAHANIFDVDYVNEAFARRVHVHLMVPYMAEKGYRRLLKSEHMIASLELSKNMVHVKSYRDTIIPLAFALQTKYVLDGLYLKGILNSVTNNSKPAIVFEHKLADMVSLPGFLIEEDLFDMDMPNLVIDPKRPFYKLPEFQWRMKKSPASPVVTDFTHIQTLFLALHREWAVNPPCVSCGRSTTLKCRSCGVIPYCSQACASAGATHPLDSHSVWCASVRAMSDATAQLHG